MSDTKTKIFISHSSKDNMIAKWLANDLLIGVLGFKYHEIFCTSLDGMGIESGADWRDKISEALKEAEVILLLITSNYKSSEICLNEMGASWIVCENIISLIIDPVNFDTVGVLQEIRQAEILNSTKSLDRLKDRIQEIFNITRIKTDRWTEMKTEFLTKLEDYLSENPFSLPISEDIINDLEAQNKSLKSSLIRIRKEKEKLENYTKELENIKDREAIKTVKKKYTQTSNIDEFNIIVDEIRKAFNKFDSVVNTVIFNEYTRNHLEIDYQIYSKEIATAIAQKYITEDLTITGSSIAVNKAWSCLKDLNNHIDYELNAEDFEELMSDYNIEIDLENVDFWDKVLGINIIF